MARGLPLSGEGARQHPGHTRVDTRSIEHLSVDTRSIRGTRGGGHPWASGARGEGGGGTERPMAGRVVVQNGATEAVPTRTRGRISSLSPRLPRDLRALSLPTGIAFPPPFHALGGVVADLDREGDGTSLGVRFGRFRPRPDSDISAHVDLARSRIGNGTREKT